VLSNVQAKALASYGAQIERFMESRWILNGFSKKGRLPSCRRGDHFTAARVAIANPKGQYMRGSIVDLMPNPVSPLLQPWPSRRFPHVGIKEVLRPLTRSEPTLPEDYITTINEYAYMGVSYTPRQCGGFSPAVAFLSAHHSCGSPALARRDSPALCGGGCPLARQSLETMTAVELWDGIQQVNDAAMMHLASLLVATTGASAGAEGLFTRVYEKWFNATATPGDHISNGL